MIYKQYIPLRAQNKDRRSNYRISGDIKEARATTTPIKIAPAKKVLLSMASNLCWCSTNHIVTRNISPVPFPILLKPQKKQPVKF